MKHKWTRLAAALVLALLAGCAGGRTAQGQPFIERVSLEEVELEDEAVALSSSPAALANDLTPVASGKSVSKNSKATVDYSNAKDGYVMIRFTAKSDRRLKAKITGPSGGKGYQYNLTQGQWETFPLSDGNGKYEVKVYEHTGKDSKYAVVLTVSFQVTMADEFAPFIRPNQYVNYAVKADNTLKKAEELIGNETDALIKVERVYDFVVSNLTYDKQKAKTVQSGYLPVLDDVLEKKTGICFDYAALMTAMLRSQDVPCKLVVGYAGTAYHAWINVWSEETGWVDNAIYFDGEAWQRMDPTFASSSNSSEAIMKYIGDGSNYSALYFY